MNPFVLKLVFGILSQKMYRFEIPSLLFFLSIFHMASRNIGLSKILTPTVISSYVNYPFTAHSDFDFHRNSCALHRRSACRTLSARPTVEQRNAAADEHVFRCDSERPHSQPIQPRHGWGGQRISVAHSRPNQLFLLGNCCCCRLWLCAIFAHFFLLRSTLVVATHFVFYILHFKLYIGTVMLGLVGNSVHLYAVDKKHFTMNWEETTKYNLRKYIYDTCFGMF